MRTLAKPRHVKGLGVKGGLVCIGRIGNLPLCCCLPLAKRRHGHMSDATWRTRG